MASTMTMAKEEQKPLIQNADLKDEGKRDPESGETKKEPEVLRPAHARYCHAGMEVAFLLFGKENGWAGFCFMCVATLCSVSASVNISWLAGCVVMMVFFASTLCFSGYQAVSGRYELARPLLFSGMCLFISCILGGHFFQQWAKYAGSAVYPHMHLSQLPLTTQGYKKNSFFSMVDGNVDVEKMSEFKLCKSKLPVVGTCVYNYYCVAPIISSADTPVYAWAGILSHSSCDQPSFLTSPERLEWEKPAREGVGIVKNAHWDSAIAAAVSKFSLTTSEAAPLMAWQTDPTKLQREAWNMGWTVEFCVFGGYLMAMLLYSCVMMDYTTKALPTARKIIDPNAQEKPGRRKLTMTEP